MKENRSEYIANVSLAQTCLAEKSEMARFIEASERMLATRKPRQKRTLWQRLIGK
jgi:hypothetical protein